MKKTLFVLLNSILICGLVSALIVSEHRKNRPLDWFTIMMTASDLTNRPCFATIIIYPSNNIYKIGYQTAQEGPIYITANVQEWNGLEVTDIVSSVSYAKTNFIQTDTNALRVWVKEDVPEEKR